MSELFHKFNDVETRCKGDGITVRHVREWLASLPDEWQDKPFEGTFGGMPVSLKRLVAYKEKGPKDRELMQGVVANPMGTHLPFDDRLEWKHVLS